MFSSRLRNKRVIVPTLVAALALGAGGVFWAASASADLGGSERDRVVNAAKAAAGDGRVLSAESSDSDEDDRDPVDRAKAYEVELRKADGSTVEITLSKDLTVLEQQRDDEDSATADSPDADDRVLSSPERNRAEQAATDAVGGGTATTVEASDDRGVAYDVEVTATDGTTWDVDLDSSFAVVRKGIDR